jgi:Ca2+-transporting ATPase
MLAPLQQKGPIMPKQTAAMVPPEQGLTARLAANRLAKDGPNDLPQPPKRGIFRVVLDVLKEPMLALLLVGGAIYFALGSLPEALSLGVFACLSIGITVFQQARSEKVLSALRDLTSPKASVLRDGAVLDIPAREVVVGDTLMLIEGRRIAADALLSHGAEVTVDTSLLTGESAPQHLAFGGKNAQVFSGSLVVGGSGLAHVTATGPRSEIGKIGAALAAPNFDAPVLQRQMRRLVWWFALIGGAVSLAVVLLQLLVRGSDPLAALLAGIAVGMAMLPEEFPMVMAVFLAMGARRMSRVGVLTRRASAIETLGAATVLCSDKTGTMTQNKMQIAQMILADGRSAAIGKGAPLPDFAALARAGSLACPALTFDPMEKAFLHLCPQPKGRLLRSYPFSHALLAMTQVWNLKGASHAYAKGAPEAIAALCNMPKGALQKDVDAMAAQGLRVLAVAVAKAPSDLPQTMAGFDFDFVGIVGLADPLRKGVAGAVKIAMGAGIRVVMITGDHPATARAIAAQAGLAAGDVLTGAELAGLSDKQLRKAVATAQIFARITPLDKLRIVQALRANGEIVAMTGDGVNDAPSLRAAHIGIAMGGRGTDVAREAAQIVLLDDDFGAIITTISLGRRIYANLRHAMSFILAVHVPIAGLALLPLLTGAPLLFGPIHIALLEMIIDPVSAFVFEAEKSSPDQMRAPPRPANEALLSPKTARVSLLQGLLAFLASAGVYEAALWAGLPDGEIRALTFVSLVCAIAALIFVNRASTRGFWAGFRRPNRTLFVVLGTLGSIIVLVMALAPARDLLGFELSTGFWPAVPAAAFAAVYVFGQLVRPVKVGNRTAANTDQGFARKGGAK